MFARTVINQSIKIHDLESKLNLEKEANTELRNENIDLSLKTRHLKQFKKNVIDIMQNKGTIVSKYDKIKELIDKLERDNQLQI